MKDSLTQLLTEEIKAATHLLERSWNSAYREAYLHGKIYAYKKLLELEEKKSYTQEHAQPSGQ